MQVLKPSGKYRVAVGFMFQVLFTTGAAVLGIIAYFVRDWRKLHLIMGVPIFTFVSLYWYFYDLYFNLLYVITKYFNFS
jgi:hypothetical protein